MTSRRRTGYAEEDDDDMGAAPPTPTRGTDKTSTSTTAAAAADDKLLEKTLAPPQLAPATEPRAFSNHPSSPATASKESGGAHKVATASRPARPSHQSSEDNGETGTEDDDLEADSFPGAIRVGGDDPLISMIAAKENSNETNENTSTHYDSSRRRGGTVGGDSAEGGTLMPNIAPRGDVESQQTQQEEAPDQESLTIVAHLAPDEDKMAERVAKRAQAEVERRLEAYQYVGQRNSSNSTNQQPVVAAVKIEATDNEESSSSRKYWIPLLLFVIIAGIVAGVVVAVSGGGGEDENPTVTPTANNTPVPSITSPPPTTLAPTTLPPSAAPTTRLFSSRFERIYAIIAPLIDGPSVLRDDSTVQHWALRWLADTDEAQLDFERLPTHLTVERFALVLLHNYTGGSVSWSDQYHFLSSLPVCSWNKVGNSTLSTARGVGCIGSSVTDLILRENDLFGNIPTELGLMTSLTLLDLSTNSLVGSIEPILLDYMPPNMNQFWVGQNALSGSIPSNASLPARESILGIDIAFNGIEGSLDFFLQMPNLEVLSVTQTLMVGTIPTELGMLDSLRIVYLAGNELTGTIPTELGSLARLESLELGHTALTGTIPTEFGLLTSASYFGLFTTNLSGQLPSELGLLTTSLTILYLYENNGIIGTIPSEYANLRPPSGVLKQFAGHSTSLTGGFEEAWCEDVESSGLSTVYDFLTADCLIPVDPVSCSCCNWCCRAEDDCVESFSQ